MLSPMLHADDENADGPEGPMESSRWRTPPESVNPWIRPESGGTLIRKENPCLPEVPAPLWGATVSRPFRWLKPPATFCKPSGPSAFLPAPR